MWSGELEISEPKVEASALASLRPARAGDIPALVNHRRWMFEDMAHLDGRSVDPAKMDAMDEAYAAYLPAHLADGSMVAWVVELDGQICASGAVSILRDYPPHYANLRGWMPMLHGMYTLPEHRRKGYARRIVEQAIAYCRENGFSVLSLNASREGRPLYESLGFKPGIDMRLKLQVEKPERMQT
jgi:GNAT superfamily N-acetyltransferase